MNICLYIALPVSFREIPAYVFYRSGVCLQAIISVCFRVSYFDSERKGYPAVMAVCSNPFLATMIQVRANLETYNGTGRIKEVPATAFLIGTFKEFPLGNIKPQENAEYETTMSVTYAKLVVDGVEIFEIDVLENIYKVGMVDMLSTFKKNTGA